MEDVVTEVDKLPDDKLDGAMVLKTKLSKLFKEDLIEQMEGVLQVVGNIVQLVFKLAQLNECDNEQYNELTRKWEKMMNVA
jgi:hypothetical protein